MEKKIHLINLLISGHEFSFIFIFKFNGEGMKLPNAYINRSQSLLTLFKHIKKAFFKLLQIL